MRARASPNEHKVDGGCILIEKEGHKLWYARYFLDKPTHRRLRHGELVLPGATWPESGGRLGRSQKGCLNGVTAVQIYPRSADPYKAHGVVLHQRTIMMPQGKIQP